MKRTLSLCLMLMLALGLPLAALAEHAQGITDDTVLIANSIAVSGALAPVGVPSKLGIEAYLKKINDAGGINGRTIEYIHRDDEFLPEKGIAALEQFLYDDEVFAIVDHFGTPIVSATLDDMKEIGIPTVYYATGISQLYQAKAEGTDRSSMPIQPIYDTEGEVMVAYAKGYFGAERIGVVYTNDDAGKSMLTGVENAAKEYGMELVVESLQVGATDATAQVAKVKDCDVVIGAMIQNTLPSLIKEMEKQDVMIPVITSYVNISLPITQANAEHVQKLMHTEEAGIYALGWVEIDVTAPEYIEFTEYMKAVGGEEQINSYSMTGWIAADAFCQGLARIPADADITWEAFYDAMESAPVLNPFGGQIDFADGQRKGTTSMNLSRMDDQADVGWTTIVPIKTIDEILAGIE